MGIEDLAFVLGGVPGLIAKKVFSKDNDNTTVTPTTNATTVTATPFVLGNENVNTDVISPKVQLKHGGEAEILKGHDYIKDLL